MGNPHENLPDFHDARFVGVPSGFGSHIPPRPKKSVLLAYLFAIPPFGFLGAHHFYLGRHEFGVLYFFTLGLGLCGWFWDLFRMPCIVHNVNEERYEMNPSKKKTSLDAYLLWGTPFGLLGFHHYYLRRWPWGVAYTFTLGLAGVGWLCDSCRMYSMVKESNNRTLNRLAPVQNPNELADDEDPMSLSDAYVLAISPFGILGAHHYYMGRFFVGMVYTFSMGLLGIGWIMDLFNLPVLFRRAHHVKLHWEDRTYYLDDAYRLLWPYGFLGLHYFYLRQPCRGTLYLFTFGFLLIGWLIDFIRLPKLVKDANKRLREERAHLAEIRERLGPNVRILGDQRAYVAYASRDGQGGIPLPPPPPQGGQLYSIMQTSIPNTSQQSPPPPYSGLSGAVPGNLPPPYNTSAMTTISEDDENIINEEASQSSFRGSENIAFRGEKA